VLGELDEAVINERHMKDLKSTKELQDAINGLTVSSGGEGGQEAIAAMMKKKKQQQEDDEMLKKDIKKEKIKELDGDLVKVCWRYYT
jgi:hypothetical protein